MSRTNRLPSSPSGDGSGSDHCLLPTRACKVKNTLDNQTVASTRVYTRKRTVRVRASDRIRNKQQREERTKTAATKLKSQGVENRNIAIEFGNPYHKSLFLHCMGLSPKFLEPSPLTFHRVAFIPSSLHKLKWQRSGRSKSDSSDKNHNQANSSSSSSNNVHSNQYEVVELTSDEEDNSLELDLVISPHLDSDDMDTDIEKPGSCKNANMNDDNYNAHAEKTQLGQRNLQNNVIYSIQSPRPRTVALALPTKASNVQQSCLSHVINNANDIPRNSQIQQTNSNKIVQKSKPLPISVLSQRYPHPQPHSNSNSNSNPLIILKNKILAGGKSKGKSVSNSQFRNVTVTDAGRRIVNSNNNYTIKNGTESTDNNNDNQNIRRLVEKQPQRTGNITQNFQSPRHQPRSQIPSQILNGLEKSKTLYPIRTQQQPQLQQMTQPRHQGEVQVRMQSDMMGSHRSRLPVPSEAPVFPSRSRRAVPAPVSKSIPMPMPMPTPALKSAQRHTFQSSTSTHNVELVDLAAEEEEVEDVEFRFEEIRKRLLAVDTDLAIIEID